jgi:CHAT domain-containing protein/lipopolysaccharide biosynthesis regulator YciM
MRFLLIYQICVSLFGLIISSVYAHPQIQEAQLAFEKGHFEESVQHWQKVLDETIQNSSQHFKAQINLAKAYQALGFYEETCKTLLATLPSIKKIGNYEEICKTLIIKKILDEVDKLENKEFQVEILNGLGDFHIAIQQTGKAKKCLDKAESIAKEIGNQLLLAEVLNKQGNLRIVMVNYTDAIENYEKSLRLVTENPTLTAKVSLNLAQTITQADSPENAKKKLKDILETVNNLPASHLKSFGLISLSHLVPQIEQEFEELKPWLFWHIAYNGLLNAKESAEKTQDTRALSYVYGSLGKLYETRQRYEEAMRLTRKALFLIQQEDFATPLQSLQNNPCDKTKAKTLLPMPEMAYRWYWQLGRLFKAQGKREKAINMYQFAVEHLNIIQHRLIFKGYRSQPGDLFREIIAPVYLELVDLLFERAKQAAKVGKDDQTDLKRVQETLERLKEYEIKQFLELGPCAQIRRSTPEERNPLLEQSKAAVLYTILLNDSNLKLLLNLDEQLYPFTIDVLGKHVKEKVTLFKEGLTTPSYKKNDKEFWQLASDMYQWLIARIEAKLVEHKIKTLIIVPDGELRTIPFAALYDENNKQFLIEKYALAIVQALNITDFQKSLPPNPQIFLGGVSKAVQDFSPLPNVPKELRNIQALYKNPVPLFLDEKFNIVSLKNKLTKTSYHIIHFASHANFGSNLNNTYLLTFDGRLNLNQLEKLVKHSLDQSESSMELITLSACETAQGEGRAALGLAGITLKAGARSALASLWQVNDGSTSELMQHFYQGMTKDKLSKAEALQQAQKKLLKHENEDYQHPHYWAPFILIGNWL